MAIYKYKRKNIDEKDIKYKKINFIIPYLLYDFLYDEARSEYKSLTRKLIEILEKYINSKNN